MSAPLAILLGGAVLIASLAPANAAAKRLNDSNPRKAGKPTAITNKATRLCLELVRTEPVPVIGAYHPDAKDIPAGFAIKGRYPNP